MNESKFNYLVRQRLEPFPIILSTMLDVLLKPVVGSPLPPTVI